MLSRLVRIQLGMFTGITVLALLLTALFYVKVPQQMGIGRYQLVLHLSDSGGIYEKANVLYRGTEVGVVTSVEVKEGGGVTVALSIDNDAEIPKSAVAEVRSVSVVGEQYVNFVPPASAKGGPYLADGDIIAAGQTSLPTTTSALLTSINKVVGSVPLNDLRTVLKETDEAFGGSGEDLAQVIRSASNLEDEATRNLGPTTQLIRDANGVLATQQEVASSIRSYAGTLEPLSAQLEASSADIEGLLASGPSFFDQTTKSLNQLKTPVTRLLADTATVGNVLNAYAPAVEHVLTLYNALAPSLAAASPISWRDDEYGMLRLFFKLGFDPPLCVEGYPEAGKMRSAHDTSKRPVSQTTYCKAPRDSNLAPRGVRNSPCPNNQSVRGAYAKDCGLVFPRVPSPTGLRQTDSSALVDPDSSSRLSIITSGTPAGPQRSWQEWMRGLTQ